MCTRGLLGLALLSVAIAIPVDVANVFDTAAAGEGTLANFTDQALCFVLNKAIGVLSKKPLTIPAMSGGGGCGLRWSAGPGTIDLKGVAANGCQWIDNPTGFGAAVSIEGINVAGLPGYATDYKHVMWPVGCMHLGDAHFKASVQATARVQLVLPKTLKAPCKSSVSLPYFHDDVDVTDGGFEGGLKQKIVNAMHGSMQSEMQKNIAGSTTSKICSFVTGCQAGIRRCAQDAENTFKTCFNVTHPDPVACEKSAKATLTQSCAAVVKDCL